MYVSYYITDISGKSSGTKSKSIKGVSIAEGQKGVRYGQL